MTDGEAPDGDSFLEALRLHWADVLERADPDQRARLIDLVSGIGNEDNVDLRSDLADVVLEFLPGDHPVSRSLGGGVMYGSGLDEESLQFSLERLRVNVLSASDVIDLGDPDPDLDDPDPDDLDLDDPDLDDFDVAVRADLRSYPAHDAGDLDGDGLLLLPAGIDGRAQVPSFQLDDAGNLRPVVRQINTMLDARADPWGVMCWWVYPHARLPVPPAELLDVDEELLLQAARAVMED